MRRALGLALALLAAPALAQEPAPAADPFPIAAAGWCHLTDGDSDPPTDPETEVTEDTSPGCDLGVAAALYRFRRLPRLSIVGALGAETLGFGLGWTFHRTPAGTAYGVALGPTAPWGPDGIEIDRWGLSLGATLSFTRGAREP